VAVFGIFYILGINVLELFNVNWLRRAFGVKGREGNGNIALHYLAGLTISAASEILIRPCVQCMTRPPGFLRVSTRHCSSVYPAKGIMGRVCLCVKVWILTFSVCTDKNIWGHS
jgi:hypothetical protein